MFEEKKLTKEELAKQAGEWLTPAEFAAVFKVPLNTQAVWRTRGNPGLPYYRMGVSVRYKRSEIEAWLESRKRHVNAGGEECQR